MLTAGGCRARRDRLGASLSSPCDVLIVADPDHLVDLANDRPSPFEFRRITPAGFEPLSRHELRIDQPGAPAWGGACRPVAPPRSSRGLRPRPRR